MYSFRYLIVIVLVTAASAGYGALPLALDGEELPSLAPMLEKVQPSVVNVSARRGGLGSGVIVDAENGYAITNHHVIRSAESITVTLQDGRELEAELVGSDPASDVAVIKMQPGMFTSIPIGVSENLRVGDFVVAIGSPFGLSQTVTSGIVSALGRNRTGITGYEDFIQTDASINPGNSGGALVNLRGELVGINTAIFSRSGGSQGIGFSIPIDMAMSLMEQLLEHGDIKRGLLGVRMQDLTPTLADAFGISGEKGAVISEVIAGSAAQGIGMEEGDVIIEFNGDKVEDSADLRNAVGLVRPGNETGVRFYRDGELITRLVRIRERNTIATIDGGLVKRLRGARFRTASPQAEITTGVEVVSIEPGSPAVSSGLAEGDIIVSVNRQAVATLGEMQQVVSRSPGILLIRLIRDRRLLFLVVR